MRKAGILLHISSLPGNYGIGNFGKSAYDFVDFLKDGHQLLWQLLPLGVTGFADSPYQAFSSYAGNPYFIDPEALYEMGLVTKSELDGQKFGNGEADYGMLYEKRYPFLRKAMENFDSDNTEYQGFCKDNSDWLEIFAEYMSAKQICNGRGIAHWDRALRQRKPSELEKLRRENKSEYEFWKKSQFFFFKGYFKLKEYANKNGVEIIGDIPIYVGADSADVWESPGLFMLDNDFNVTKQAGCPPDSFNKSGQLWGNPVYNWQKKKKELYAWWKKRIDGNFKLYDYLRIDHFRGFSAYYCIDANEKSAVNGAWEKGPGYDLFEKLGLKGSNIIAEDLGFIDDDTRALLEKCGFFGMKILEFGFDGDSSHLVHSYEKNTVAYTGTHDNEPFMSYFKTASTDKKDYIKNYLASSELDVCFNAVRALYMSNSDFVIIQFQDILKLDFNARMNTPSTVGINWRWRANIDDFDKNISKELAKLARLYGRA